MGVSLVVFFVVSFLCMASGGEWKFLMACLFLVCVFVKNCCLKRDVINEKSLC